MGAPHRLGASVLIREEQHAIGDSLADDLQQRHGLVGPGGELLVGLADGQHIVNSDAPEVSVGEVERLAVADLHQGCG